MKTNQLPPELVEKYDQAIRGYEESDDVFRFLRHKNHCAQIAVQHAENKTDHLIDHCKDLSRQRDELIEVSNDMVEGFKQLLIETGNPNKATDFTFVRRYLELLKKHEDGKG